MAKHEEAEKEENTERWALTYSDMITLLLALFIMLYSISNVDAEKYKKLAEQLHSQFGDAIGSGVSNESGASLDPNSEINLDNVSLDSVAIKQSTETQDKFETLYDLLNKNIVEQGLDDKVSVEKTDTYIHFRLKDSILFYPDSAKMRDEGLDVLKYMGDCIYNVIDLIQSVQIEGHTADIGYETNDNFFAWQLSSDRSIAVLSTLVSQCKIPQRVMSIAGYSHYMPVADNSTPEGRAKNRRVEITITRVAKDNSPQASSGAEKNEQSSSQSSSSQSQASESQHAASEKPKE